MTVTDRPTRRTIGWSTAKVVRLHTETATAKSMVLDVPDWPGHLPGQHVDLRLTALDGYTTQRSYSIASPANGTLIELTVQRLPDGEVSPFLVDELALDDQLEPRGPIGGWFVWDPESAGEQPAGGGRARPIIDPDRAVRAFRRLR